MGLNPSNTNLDGVNLGDINLNNPNSDNIKLGEAKSRQNKSAECSVKVTPTNMSKINLFPSEEGA